MRFIQNDEREFKMMTGQKIIDEMTQLIDEDMSINLSRFFKTGPGEYGEGDKFLGIKVPVTRSIVKKYKDEITLEDIEELISSEWHEIRLAGFLLLVELYNKSIKTGNIDDSKTCVEFYLDNIHKGNNWDLVDLVSYKLLGDWITRNRDFEGILEQLSCMKGYLWHQRVAIVSTMALIKRGEFELTFKLARNFLIHPHDLIHKATGWMLREVGKRGGKEKLILFLNEHKNKMPRTMLRYAIEKFTPEERKKFVPGKGVGERKKQ